MIFVFSMIVTNLDAKSTVDAPFEPFFVFKGGANVPAPSLFEFIFSATLYRAAQHMDC
jgi:hypothetical protein